MEIKRIFSVGFLGGLALLILCATLVSAGSEAPEVVGPENLPGADVVWYANVEYTLDATGSTDNVGIVLYEWEIEDQSGFITMVSSTTPTATWTPTSPGIYRVISWAEDEAGNRGYYVYAVDVAEVLVAGTYADMTIARSHSLVVNSGQVILDNVKVQMSGGRPHDTFTPEEGEMFTEGVTWDGYGGDLAGHWEPYSTSTSYGKIYRDTSTVLVGQASVRNSGGSYGYGFTWYFDEPQDLSGYKSFVYFLRSGGYASAGTSSFYYLTTQGSYYTYAYCYAGTSWANGWLGYTISLDPSTVGYTSCPTSALRSTLGFRIYFYNYQPPQCWIDGAYLSTGSYGDNITESRTPSGEWAGSWSGIDGISTRHYVGRYSVYDSGITNYQYPVYTYTWNDPADLSGYNGLRLFTYFATGNYLYLDRVTITDWSGEVADWSRYSSYFFHYYATYNYGKWYICNIPMDSNMYFASNNFDWTQIRSITFNTYSYTGTATCTLYIDGMEFYKAKPVWTPPPVLTEDIPFGIYAIDTGSLTMKGSEVSYSGALGTFIKTENDLSMDGCTLSGLYGWPNTDLPPPIKAAGGVMAYGCDVTLKNVKVTDAAASGFHLVDCNVSAESLDITGTGRIFADSAGFVIDQRSGSDGIPYEIIITDSKMYGNSLASGFMISLTNALGGADITLDDVRCDSNGRDGGVISTGGFVGPISVEVLDCTFTSNSQSGLIVQSYKDFAYKGKTVYDIISSEFRSNSLDGLRTNKYQSETETIVNVLNCYFQTNNGNGIRYIVNGLRGSILLDIDTSNLERNRGSGLYSDISQGTYSGGKPDIDPRFLQDDGEPVGDVEVLVKGSTINHNSGNGIYSTYYIAGPASVADQPAINYNMEVSDTTISSNSGVGFYQYPSSTCAYGAWKGTYTFRDCEVVDNGNYGFYFYEDGQIIYAGSGYSRNTYNIINCSIESNNQGIREYFNSYCYGIEVWVNVDGCTIMDNPGGAIYGYGYESTYGGQSYLQHAEWNVRNCTISDSVHLDLSGAYSYSGRWEDLSIYIVMEDNVYASNDPIYLAVSSYYAETYVLFDGRIIYRRNEHTLPILGDALTIEVFGGISLVATVLVSECTFNDVFEDGINIMMGTLYTSTSYSRTLVGNILIQDVTVSKCMDTGVYFNIAHTGTSDAMNKARFSMRNVTIDGASVGLYSEAFNGELIGCTFSNIRTRSIIVSNAIVDVFSTDIGVIDERNLFVDLMGAIRLWFDLNVQVVWEDTGQHIMDVNLELKDNSWDIKGINTQTSTDGVTFVNLNSHTVLSEGVATKNPYSVRVNYRGLVKEEKIIVEGSSSVTIGMLDDIRPRLHIEYPKEGDLTRDSEVEVKGSSYDMHTGVDVIEVSLDGETWYVAEGTDIFSYTFRDVAEGLSVILVRVCDNAGNIDMDTVSIYIDRTPPSLIVYSPINGTRTRFTDMEVVGVTDVDASVYINSQPIETEYTLISHQIRLNEGLNEIKVVVYDNLGNLRMEMRTVFLDTQRPYIEMVTDDQLVRDKVFMLQGITEPGEVTITIEDKDIPVDYKGRFEAEVDLVTGKNVFEVHGTDSVGNQRTVMVTIELDNIPPWFQIEAPVEGNIYNDRNVMVSGYVEEGAKVYVNDREVLPAFGQFVTYVYVPEGASEIDISVVDRAGNHMERTLLVRVDSIAPIIELDYPTRGMATNTRSAPVKGWIQDETDDYSDIELYVNGMPWPVDKVEGMFIGEVSLEEGYNRIIIAAWDAAMNQGNVELSITRDSTAPFLDVLLKGVHTDPQWNEPIADRKFAYVTGFTEIGATVMANGVYMEVDPDSGYFNQTVEIPAPLPGKKIYALAIEVTSADEAGNVAAQTVVVNRIEGVEEETVSEISTAEWLVLFLAIVILGIALFGAVGYQRITVQDEVIEAYESTPTTVVVSGAEPVAMPPPRRPRRGGVPRKRAPPPEEKGDDLVLEIDEEVE